MKLLNSYNLIIILIAVALTSCNRNSKSKLTDNHYTPSLIKINPDSIQLDFAKYFKNHYLFQVDSNVVFGDFLSVFEDKGKMIIRGETDDYIIFTLDTKTKELNKIVKKGKGPDEYLSLQCLEYTNDCFGMLDYWKRSITHYNLSSEKKISTTKIPSYYHAFAYLDSSHIVLFKDVSQENKKNVSEFRLNIFNVNTKKITRKYFPIIKGFAKERSISNSYRFYHINDTLCYFKSYRDTVYNIFSDKVTPRYVLEQGKFKFPDKLYWDKRYNLREFMKLNVEGNYIRNIDNFYESNDFVFFTFVYENKMYYNFYNKQTGKCETSCNLTDSLFLQSFFPFSRNYIGIEPIGGNEKSLFFKLEPYYLIEKINELKEELSDAEWKLFKTMNQELINIYSNFSINDNQILIKYEYKD